jgi:hypothetical protein
MPQPITLPRAPSVDIGHMETKLCKPVSTGVALKCSLIENSLRKPDSTPMCAEIPVEP